MQTRVSMQTSVLSGILGVGSHVIPTRTCIRIVVGDPTGGSARSRAGRALRPRSQ